MFTLLYWMLIHFVNRIKMSAIYSTNTQSIFHVSFFFLASIITSWIFFTALGPRTPWMRENTRRRERYVITTIKGGSTIGMQILRDEMRAMVAQRYLMSFDFIYGYRNTRDPRAKIYNLVQSWRDRNVGHYGIPCVFSKVSVWFYPHLRLT